MRRFIVLVFDDTPVDPRARQLNEKRLQPGDAVEVFSPSDRRWKRGTFYVSRAGDVLIDLPFDDAIPFAQAVADGLRRVLH